MKVWLTQQLSADAGIVYVICAKHIDGLDPIGAPDGYARKTYPSGEVKDGVTPPGNFPGAERVTCYRCFKDELKKRRGE